METKTREVEINQIGKVEKCRLEKALKSMKTNKTRDPSGLLVSCLNIP